MNWVSIGISNGLSPVQCQAITCNKTDILSIGPLEHILVLFESKYKTFQLFIHENALENVCEIAAILSKGVGLGVGLGVGGGEWVSDANGWYLPSMVM